MNEQLDEQTIWDAAVEIAFKQNYHRDKADKYRKIFSELCSKKYVSKQHVASDMISSAQQEFEYHFESNRQMEEAVGRLIGREVGLVQVDPKIEQAQAEEREPIMYFVDGEQREI